MYQIKKTALINFSCEKMYQLVNDINAYPQFLPWCSKASILSQSEQEMKAELVIAKAGVHKSLITINRLTKNQKIEMRLAQGPFSDFQGIWRFQALNDNACKISFDIQFQFANGFVEKVIAPIFIQISDTWVDAFCQRARQLYAGA